VWAVEKNQDVLVFQLFSSPSCVLNWTFFCLTGDGVR